MAGTEFSLRELVRALEGATAETKHAVADLVREASIATATQVAARYPLGKTGILRARVVARAGTKRGSFDSGGVNLTWYARAFAPHVHIIEEGTRPRYDPTRGNAFRGRGPQRGPIFIPIAATQRQQLLAQAAALLERSQELV